MIRIRCAEIEELPDFVRMELDSDNSPFVNADTLDRHTEWFEDKGFVHLAIVEQENLLGYVLLVLEPDEETVELRRIVVTQKGKGFGQKALELVDAFCRDIDRSVIWLDVMRTNYRARHVYKKLGFARFEPKISSDEDLVFMRKHIR